MPKLTDNFTSDELWAHRAKPTDIQLRTLYMLARTVLQPLRTYIMLPIVITSGYREGVVPGGSATSEHFYLGHEGAVDINIGTPNVKTNLVAFNWLATNCLYGIGQLIWYTETTHLHISLAGTRHQGELLVCTSKTAHTYERVSRASAIVPLDKRLNSREAV